LLWSAFALSESCLARSAASLSASWRRAASSF